MIVWLVNPFDNTPMEGYRPQRYWLMAKAFVRAGQNVVYWTSDFSHATKRKRAIVREINDGFEVRMLPSIPYGSNICLMRVMSHRALAREWLRQARLEEVSPDIVIASMPPLGLCGAALMYAKECGAMFIADVQDAWPETFERVLPGFVFHLLGMRGIAKRIYREADGISAVAKRYVELAQQYGSDAPAAVFGHCIEMLNGTPETVPKERADLFDRPLRLVYAGNMSLSYDLKTLVTTVAGMDDVTLDIAGDGPDLKMIKSLVKMLQRGQGQITFHGYLKEADLAKLLSECDVGIIPMFPDSCVGVPGKIADYAAAGLSVIESLGGETADLVDCYGVGEHYTAGDVVSLRKAICSVKVKGRHGAFADIFNANKVMNGYVKWTQAIYRCRVDWGSTRGPHYDPMMGGRNQRKKDGI